MLGILQTELFQVCSCLGNLHAVEPGLQAELLNHLLHGGDARGTRHGDRDRRNSGCPFYLWGLLAFLGLALVISLIFNISHYVDKRRRGDYCDVAILTLLGSLQGSSVFMFKRVIRKQVPAEDQMCYATLDHSFKGKRRRPRKQNANFSDREKDAQVCAMDASISQINFPPDNQAVEESVHDDPARLFGLIRAKREPAI
ncbi:T cell receptor associated transmembrane adaptor 1 [Cricetulus griseus]